MHSVGTWTDFAAGSSLLEGCWSIVFNDHEPHLANMSKIIDLYPPGLDSQQVSDIVLRQLFCQFLACSLLVVIARNQDIVQDQVSHAHMQIGFKTS